MVARSEASTIETGSSATMMRGLSSRARATMTRWRWPPLSWCGIAAERLLGAQADGPQRGLDQLAGLGPSCPPAGTWRPASSERGRPCRRGCRPRRGPGRSPGPRGGSVFHSSRDILVRGFALVQDLAAGRADDAEQQARERRLAAAALAGDGGDRRSARRGSSAEAFEGDELALLEERPRAELLGDVARFEQGGHVAQCPHQVAGGRAARPDFAERRHLGRAARGRQADSAGGTRSRRADSRSEGGMPGMPLKTCLPSRRGQTRDQQLGVGMERLLEDICDRADLDQLAAYITAKRSTNCAISPMSWPTRMTAAPSSACTLPERLHDLALHDHVERAGRLVGDDEPGLQARSRWRCRRAASCRRSARAGTCAPPAGAARPGRGGASTFLYAWSSRRPLAVGSHRVDELLADAHHRVERVHRALRDQGDLAEAEPAHLLVREPCQVHVAQEDLAALDAPGGMEEAHQREGRGRLAGAGLADEAEPLAPAAG